MVRRAATPGFVVRKGWLSLATKRESGRSGRTAFMRGHIYHHQFVPKSPAFEAKRISTAEGLYFNLRAYALYTFEYTSPRCICAKYSVGHDDCEQHKQAHHIM